MLLFSELRIVLIAVLTDSSDTLISEESVNEVNELLDFSPSSDVLFDLEDELALSLSLGTLDRFVSDAVVDEFLSTSRLFADLLPRVDHQE